MLDAFGNRLPVGLPSFATQRCAALIFAFHRRIIGAGEWGRF